MSASRPVRGRLAPSPTGFLHLGNAWAFLLAWLACRSKGGSLVLRMEDIDPDRSRPEYADAIIRDLRWLGLDWDEGPDAGGPAGPYVQSARMGLYADALNRLDRAGHIYPCYCTRKELRTLAGAPHVGDAGAAYPGTCRNLPPEHRAELEAAYGPKLRPMDCYKETAPGELTNCVGHDDLMMLMFTSGTTGRSKGVMLSERNMCASLHTYSEVAENWITNRLPAGQKLPLSHMTLLPLFHMACFVCVMSYPPAGWALNLCGDIRDFYRDLGLMHSDVMASAPMLVETIYNDMKRGRVSRLNGLWDLCCSSAALDPKMLLELAQNGFVVNQCYGMTETFGDGILNFTQVEKHMSAVGKPDDHVQYKLDETGEICIKGDCVMLGYYKDPEATAEVIDADGWFHTGDLARMDEEGFYYITGRKKNLIILASGENVSPEELEKKLALCPAITECIVKEKDQKICAVIYCPEDKQEEVRAFVIEVNRSLPLYKRISAVEFTAEPLPRNALGKLLRK